VTDLHPTRRRGLTERLRPEALTGDDPVLAGVASRVAGHLGAGTLVVRVGLLVLTLAGGAGIVAYPILWAVTGPVVTRRPVTLRHNLGIVAATVALVVLLHDVLPSVDGGLLWPVLLAGFALAIAESAGQRAGAERVGGDRRRVLAGIVLMVAGLVAAFAGTSRLGELVAVLPAIAVVLGGLALVVGPWLRRVLADAEAARAESARAEARADMAAHLHDSVLQTLTLIQNRAGEPEVAAALAHQQERDLRRWLYGVGSEVADRDTSLRAALEATAAEVEDQYLKVIECVVVGDAPLTDDLRAVVAAAREAMVNAAKFSDIALISLYGEVETGADGHARRAEVFVRDRGVGFEPAALPADRHGVRDSIIGRVARAGGVAEVRSEPGRGTEVVVRWPR
jgi:signal transduction histidine kinase